MGLLAGVGGGVFFTPIAVGLLGVDVNLARAGGAPRGGVFCGWVFPGGGLLRLVAYAGAAMSLGTLLGARPVPRRGCSV